MWVIFALSSAFLLGVYDVFKKLSVNKNAILPVLFLSSLVGAILVLPAIIGSTYFPDFFKAAKLYVPDLNLQEHLQIILKSFIVSSSWILSFFALKHLPITIVSPIRSTSPLWTLLGAILIFQERLNLLQWSGIVVTLFFFYLLSTAGKLEGIYFRRNKWVLFIVLGTLIASVSGLYDKFIIGRIDRLAVQAWFSIYQLLFLGPVLLLTRYSIKKEKRVVFEWRWAIPAISIFLLLADFLYFYALSLDGALISVISALRRGGVVVAFVTGALIFKEQNIRKKGIYLLGILAGILLISFGSA